MRTLLVDTGVFVAMLGKRDEHHAWVKARLATLRASDVAFVTCEAVLAEAFYLVESRGGHRKHLIALLDGMRLVIDRAWDSRVLDLMQTYERADFADACLVHLYEQLASEEVVGDWRGVPTVFTVDRDFFVYRDDAGRPLDVIHPDTHPV